jgi:hypothetical protein
MKNDNLTLEIKKGWKIYQLIAGILMIVALVFLAFQMAEIIHYVGFEGILFITLMVLLCSGSFYMLLYSFKHRIEFTDTKMIRRGIFNSKDFPYENISKIIFSDSYWKVSPTIKLIGDSKAIHIDFKYDKEDKEKVIQFLETKFENEADFEIVIS